MKKELNIFVLIVGAFLACYFFPLEGMRFGGPLYEALALVKDYARAHVLLCLVPAFFIAGAVSIFVSRAAVVRYFGAKAHKVLAYGVASVSGAILAVCSCTVLPLFSGIYRRGAGLGPAIAFLYSGPAINVLAIVLTARVLGWEIGLARAVGAIVFSVVIGFLMHVIFLKGERARQAEGELDLFKEIDARPLGKTASFFFVMVALLVFMNWGRPPEGEAGAWGGIYGIKWLLTGVLGVVLLCMVRGWFVKSEIDEWMAAAWRFAKQILPLLLVGVLISGFLLGRPGHEGVIPSGWVVSWVGGNGLMANFLASLVGALMYFATLTEIPILQGLLGVGMGKGPALALLLAGPALSLPNMLVIRGVIGTKKTLVYVLLVVVMATFSGWLFGCVAS